MRLLYRQQEPSAPDTPDVRSHIDPPEAVYDNLKLPEPGADRPHVAVNMVSTVDGRITLGVCGKESKLGSRVDRDVMFRLRYHFDAVVRGAGTVRQGPWYPRVPDDLADRREEQGLPRHPLAVVITSSCVLPFEREFFAYAEAPSPTVVITTESAPAGNLRAARDAALVRFAGKTRVNIQDALRILAEEFGVGRLLSEGGARLNWDFIQAGCLDELYWTLTPKFSGYEHDLPLVRGPELLNPVPSVDLVSLYYHEGELYGRWRVGTDDDPRGCEDSPAYV